MLLLLFGCHRRSKKQQRSLAVGSETCSVLAHSPRKPNSPPAPPFDALALSSLRPSLPTKPQLLASNVNTYRAINSSSSSGSGSSAAGGAGGRGTAVGGGGRAKPAQSKKSKKAAAGAVDAMDEDGSGPHDGDAGRTTEAEVKELVEGVLKAESLEGKRAASMDIDDLLGLLSAFNEKGVHFA